MRNRVYDAYIYTENYSQSQFLITGFYDVYLFFTAQTVMLFKNPWEMRPQCLFALVLKINIILQICLITFTFILSSERNDWQQETETSL